MSMREPTNGYRGRRAFILGVLASAMGLLVWRGVDLQVLDRDFLQQQGDARSLRVVDIVAHRGMITDRHGEPLAISTPVDSVWANPQILLQTPERLPALAKLLELDPQSLGRMLRQRKGREFVYLRRQIQPELGQQVMALKIPGVSLQREYRRYYPTGEVCAHVVGFTNVDDAGQEGLELLYNKWLQGTPGAKRVIKDRLGRIVENVERIRAPKPGRDLKLSIDRRIQYLAYRELKAAVQRHHARAGSAVVMDVHTGEVLAMVNQPSYNPNNRSDLTGARARNRAVTDVFEPGSTIKPFTIAAALDSGRYTPGTVLNTHPGFLRIGSYTIRDHRDYGKLDVTHIIQKSSNVGASLIALSLNPQQLWHVFTRVGFGVDTGSGFPGEASGSLIHYSRWSEVRRATLSYGYGLSVTPLQLARAYTVLAGDGKLRPVSFLALDKEEAAHVEGVAALSPVTVEKVRRMLETVVETGGTGTRAQVPGYRVAGKTGTVHKADAGGYSAKHYLSIFAGMAPASDPRLVMVVVVDEPEGDEYYGGLVAAPVFSRVMAGALRLLDVPPDNLKPLEHHLVLAGGNV